MGTIKVVNESKFVKHLPYGEITLARGENEVDEKLLKQNIGHPGFDYDIKNGNIKIPKLEEETKEQISEKVKNYLGVNETTNKENEDDSEQSDEPEKKIEPINPQGDEVINAVNNDEDVERVDGVDVNAVLEDINELTVSESEKIINNLISIEALNHIKGEDGRKGIDDLIDERIETIKEQE